MKLIEKEKARALRKKGYSINQIVKEAGLTKASVSVWVRDIILTKKQRQGLSERGRSVESVERRKASRLFNENNRRQKIIDNAKKDFTSINLEQLKLIGIILYLGEGGKTSRGMARLANSDPLVIKIMMRFFREICSVPDNKFRCYLYIHDNLNEKSAKKYWSRLLNLPLSQFNKSYIVKNNPDRLRKIKHQYGVLRISVSDIYLLRRIKGWISGVFRV